MLKQEAKERNNVSNNTWVPVSSTGKVSDGCKVSDVGCIIFHLGLLPIGDVWEVWKWHEYGWETSVMCWEEHDER